MPCPEYLVGYSFIIKEKVGGGKDHLFLHSFFFFLIILFIYFCLCWVFVASHGLFPSSGEWGLPFVVV